MAIREYTIKEFKGLDQSTEQSGIDPGCSPDACNMDTTDGSLTVAKGFVKHLASPVPGMEPIRRLIIWRSLVTVRYIVITGNQIYAWTDTDETPEWKLIYTYQEPISGLRWDICETKIASVDYLLFACGEHSIVKWNGVEEAEEFGSEENLSDIPVNYLAMHYSRLFSAGDPDNPSRLYWSQAPGDDRTIENWTQDPASENTSGGHVDVGHSSGDPITGIVSLSNQLLIFKRASIYRLLGDRPGNYRVYRVNAEVEQSVNTACAMHGDIPYWMTSGGMFYHDGQNTQRMYNAEQIRTFTQHAGFTSCKAAQNGSRLYFTAYEGEDADRDYDNAVIVYDLLRRTYMIRRGFQIADLCAADGTLYMINDKRIIYRFEEGPDYDGEPIMAYWNTPLTDLGDKPGVKLLQELFLRGTWEGDGEGSAICVEAQIGRNLHSYRMLMPETLQDVLELPLHNEGRVLAFRFSNEAGSRWSIQGGVQILYELRSRTM